MSKYYELIWEGPFYLLKSGNSSFWSSSASKEQGIYTFCWEVNKDFLPHYIGMTENFKGRISQHIRNYLNGTYYLYDNRSLDKGEKGYIYNPNKDGLENFIRRHSEMYDALDEYFKKLIIFLAPLDGLQREDLYRIEAKLTNQIYENSKVGTILDSPKPRGEINVIIKNITISSRGDSLPKGF